MASSKFTFNYTSLIIGLGGLVLGLGIGLISSRLQPLPQSPADKIVAENKMGSEDIFTTQNATVNGKVTAVENGAITISSQKGTPTFKLNQQVYIVDTSANSKPSTDPKNIPLNQEVILNLQKVNGEFKVMTVTVIIPGSPAPIPSNLPISSPPTQK